MIASDFRFASTFAAELTAPGLPALALTGGRLEMLGMNSSEIHDRRVARHQVLWDIAELGWPVVAFPARGSQADRITRHVRRLTARHLRRTR